MPSSPSRFPPPFGVYHFGARVLPHLGFRALCRSRSDLGLRGVYDRFVVGVEDDDPDPDTPGFLRFMVVPTGSFRALLSFMVPIQLVCGMGGSSRALCVSIPRVSTFGQPGSMLMVFSMFTKSGSFSQS